MSLWWIKNAFYKVSTDTDALSRTIKIMQFNTEMHFNWYGSDLSILHYQHKCDTWNCQVESIIKHWYQMNSCVSIFYQLFVKSDIIYYILYISRNWWIYEFQSRPWVTLVYIRHMSFKMIIVVWQRLHLIKHLWPCEFSLHKIYAFQKITRKVCVKT